MKEGACGIVAMDHVDEGLRIAEGQGLVLFGRFDEAGAAGAVDSTQSHRSSACISGNFFRGEKNVTRRRAADRGDFVDFARVVLRIDGCAAGEDGEFRSENVDQVVECFAVNNAVGFGIASLFAAQAMDEHIGVLATGQFGAECVRIRGVGNEDAVRFAGEAAGGFFRGNEGGDVPSSLAKKIRASFTGVTTAGEEDARS